MNANEEAKSAQHQEVQELLPWYAAATLSAVQMTLVREHLEVCAQCRHDAAFEQRLRAAQPPMPAGLDPEAALARLMPRLDAPLLAPAPAAATMVVRVSLQERLQAWFAQAGWMPYALAGQTALIAFLAMRMLPGDSGAAEFRVLGDGSGAAPGNVVVMFRPDARLDDVERAVRAGGARVVDGPTVTGAYLLLVPDARQASALAVLRANASVQLAEPLAAQGRL